MLEDALPVLICAGAALVFAVLSQVFKWPGSPSSTPTPLPPPDTTAHELEAKEKGEVALRDREAKEEHLQNVHDDVVIVDQKEREQKVPELIRESDFLNDYLKKTGEEMRGKK